MAPRSRCVRISFSSAFTSCSLNWSGEAEIEDGVCEFAGGLEETAGFALESGVTEAEGGVCEFAGGLEVITGSALAGALETEGGTWVLVGGTDVTEGFVSAGAAEEDVVTEPVFLEVAAAFTVTLQVSFFFSIVAWTFADPFFRPLIVTAAFPL